MHSRAFHGFMEEISSFRRSHFLQVPEVSQHNYAAKERLSLQKCDRRKELISSMNPWNARECTFLLKIFTEKILLNEKDACQQQ